MSKIEQITRILKESGHVMGEGPGRDGLAAYHVGLTVRNARRYHDPLKGLRLARTAAKNWNVEIKLANDFNSFTIVSRTHPLAFTF